MERNDSVVDDRRQRYVWLRPLHVVVEFDVGELLAADGALLFPTTSGSRTANS
jgi:hypothetical protein